MNKSLISKIKIPFVIVGIILIMCAALLAFTYMPEGKCADAEISIDESKFFSNSDFEQAKGAVFSEFKNYDGCEMLSLVYSESFSDNYKKDHYPEYNSSEIMVLYSDFKTQKDMHESGFNDDCLYRQWKWIMVKKDGEWVVGGRGLP